MTSGSLEELAAVRGALLASVPVGVVLIDADGRVVESNRAAQELLDLREQADTLREVAEHVGEPISGRAIPEPELPWNRALKGQCVRGRDLSVARPGCSKETRIIAVSARPFQHARWPAPGAVIIIIDRVQLLARQSEQTVLPRYLQGVLTRVCQGRTTEEISAELNVTLSTTRMYIKRLLVRIGARNRAELILRALELGLYPLER